MSVDNVKEREIARLSAAPARVRALRPPSVAHPWPTLALDAAALGECLRLCRARRVGYRLGASVRDWRQPMGEMPGGCMALGGAGFVGWAFAVVTDGALARLCGRDAAGQHAWCAAMGFPPSPADAATRDDGVLRIAFVAPVPPSGGRRGHPGHVCLVHGARTLESYPAHGPGSRPWTGAGWQADTTVYMLTPPGLEG